MKEFELSHKTYTLHFSPSIKTASLDVQKKNGLIISIKKESKFFLGDCSPFPFYGTESLEDDIIFLENNKFLNDKTIKAAAELPALSFAFEQLQIQLSGTTFFDFFNISKVKNSYSVNTLLTVNNLDQLSSLRAKVVKIKASKENIEEIIKYISDTKKCIRLDFNGSLNFSEAKEILKELDFPNVEYIEQPVANMEDLCELSKVMNVELAPDESFRNIEDYNYLEKNGRFKYYIVKPVFFGGFNNLINVSRKSNSKFIITTSFESVLGRNYICQYPFTLNYNEAHGLGNFSYLDSFRIVENEFPVDDGVIRYHG